MASRPASGRIVSAHAEVHFQKYQGLGNNFILIDNRDRSEPALTSSEAARWCDSHFGIGGDGVIFALPPPGSAAAGRGGNGAAQGGGSANTAGPCSTDFAMRIFNSDGSEPEMCGNGIRCLAKFVADLDGKPVAGGEGVAYRVHTPAGLIVPELLPDGRVRVDMGPPTLDPAAVPTTLRSGDLGVEGQQQQQRAPAIAVPVELAGRTWSVTAVSMGNPHAVVYACNGAPIEIGEVDARLEELGPQFETLDTFPAKTNTEFVEVIDRSHVRMVVWERGAGRTMACGTGACALVVAGILEGRLDRSAACRVDLPGGPLEIEWREEGGPVFMTGPAERVFVGHADSCL